MQPHQPQPQTQIEPPKPEYHKLETVKPTPIYGVNERRLKKQQNHPQDGVKKMMIPRKIEDCPISV
ncbi:hypothetical protein [Microcoleus sp. S13_C5]|uniref:hypothetical protein n=1 Tax=Microcoleus sp. S13_C5 TaxID=3055411 RepID=UPI002FD221E3